MKNTLEKACSDLLAHQRVAAVAERRIAALKKRLLRHVKPGQPRQFGRFIARALPVQAHAVNAHTVPAYVVIHVRPSGAVPPA